MRLDTGRRGWIEASVALLFALALAWGLLRFGAAETAVLYRLFLFLVVPGAVAVIALPLDRLANLRYLPLFVIGLLLLGQVALQPTLQGRGYVHLSVGWLALFLTMRLATSGRTSSRFLVLLLILLGAVEALYGLAQAVGGYDYIGSYFRGVGRVATGTLINRNHYAGLLNMVLPLALGILYSAYASRPGRGEPRSESLAIIWIVVLASSFMGLAVMMSQSRGGTVSLVATVVFVGMMLTLGGRRSSRRGLSGATAWVLLVTMFGLGLAVGVDALLERFGQLDEHLARFEVYGNTLDMVADHPLTGVGPGMYVWRFRPYQTVSSRQLYDHAHNDYLESVADWGVPVALAGWGFVLWRFARAAIVFLESRDAGNRGLSLGCAAAIFSILAHSLVDFTLQIPALLAIFCVIVGLSWALDDRRRRARESVVDLDSRRGRR